MTDDRPFRILEGQATGSKARQVLMTGAELRLFTYRQGYQLADQRQREILEHTLRTEYGAKFPLPELAAGSVSHVYYLVVVDHEPVLLPEDDVVPIVFGLALARGGIDAARQVSYRAHMLPLASAPAES